MKDTVLSERLAKAAFISLLLHQDGKGSLFGSRILSEVLGHALSLFPEMGLVFFILMIKK